MVTDMLKMFPNNKIVAFDATGLSLKFGKPITNTAMLGALIAVSEVVSILPSKELPKR